jgi:hypothetical protein
MFKQRLNDNKMRLINLDGLSAKEIDADFIRTGKEVEAILNKGIAATAAGESGAINIYKDDDGFFRCEAMRWLKSVDKKTFDNILDVVKWADKWLPEIGVFSYED